MYTFLDYIVISMKFVPLLLSVIAVYLFVKMNVRLDTISNQLSKILEENRKNNN